MNKMKKRMKKLVSAVLVCGMLCSNTGISVLAESVEQTEAVTTETKKTTDEAKVKVATEAPAPETKAATEAPAPETKAATEAPAPETKAATEAPAPETKAATEAPAPETKAATEASASETKAPETEAAATETATSESSTIPETEAGTGETGTEVITEATDDSEYVSESVTEAISDTEMISETASEFESETDSETETESETESESESETEEAELSAMAQQEVLQDEEGNLSIKYTVTVSNVSEKTDADEVSVKTVFSKNTSFINGGETAGIHYISDIAASTAELTDAEWSVCTAANLQSAAIWNDQELAAGETKTYSFYADVNEAAESVQDLPAVFLVNEEIVSDVQWINAELVKPKYAKPQTYTYEDARVTISVVVPEGVNLPYGSVLEAIYISEGSAEWNEAVAAVEAANPGVSFTEHIFYDIHFLADGKEIQPSGEVQVNMNFKQSLEAEAASLEDKMEEEVLVVENPEMVAVTSHIQDNGQYEEVSSNVQTNGDAVEAVGFTADNFSIYGQSAGRTLGAALTKEEVLISAEQAKSFRLYIKYDSSIPDAVKNSLTNAQLKFTFTYYDVNENEISGPMSTKQIQLGQIIYGYYFGNEFNNLNSSIKYVKIQAQEDSLGIGLYMFASDGASLDSANNTATFTLVKKAVAAGETIQMGNDATYTVIGTDNKYDISGPLGLATGFHIVGFKEVNNGVHTNGNILTKLLYYGSNFGTNGYFGEISYIQKFGSGDTLICGDGSDDILVVGKDVKVDYDGQNFYLNGKKVDKPKHIYQDSDDSVFIDIDELQKNMQDLSKTFAQMEDSGATLNTDQSGQVSLGVNENGGMAVLNIRYSELKNKVGRPWIVSGISNGSSSSILINVIVDEEVPQGGAVEIPGITLQGVNSSTGEVTDFSAGKIIWNIVNADGSCYTGLAINSKLSGGTVLVPSGSFDTRANWNGSMIANSVKVSAESHRTDFTGTTGGFSVSKSIVGKNWEMGDEFTFQLSAAAGTPMPGGSTTSGGSVSATVKATFSNRTPGFGSISYDKAGTYYYTLREIAGSNQKWTYSDVVYSIRATVTENNGTLSLRYDYSTGGGADGGGTWSAAPAAYHFVNTYGETSERDITVTKRWVGDESNQNARPNSIQVRLYADGESVGTDVTLNAQNSWSYKWEKLPVKNGDQDIAYSVEEVSGADGYDGSVSGNAITGFVITNTFSTTEVSGTKTWNDNNNQDGMRPESITVRLYANGEEKTSKTVSAADNWSYSFTNLPKYADGEEIVYSVEEDSVTGYTASINGFNITNTHTPEKTSVSGTKTWNDNNDQDGMRPTSITVRLYANGKEIASKTVTEADNWSYSFTDLDKCADGEEISYTVTEDVVAGYTASINGLNITNSHTPEKTSVTVTKVWDDGNNQDGIRAEEVSVQLYADGVKQGDAVTLNEENNWTHTWTELPEKKAGEAIAYTVAEVETVEGYTTEVSGTASTGFIITNTHAPEKTSVSGTKTWNDNDDQDGMRPTSITVRLLADGVEKASQTVTAEDNWSYSFTDLDKYADGEKITYTVIEDAVEDYSTEYNGYNIVNSHTPGKTSVTVTKAWDDGNNQDGIRAEEVSVQLYADGTEQGDAVTLSEENNWTHTWTELPEKKAGKAIAYTVAEVGTLEGYTTEVSGTASTGFVVTNTHTPEKTSVSGTKTWNDNDDQDGMRPTSITVRLYANGNEIDSTSVTAEDNWSYSFTGLDKCAGGKVITYTVTEDAVAGYTASINGLNITNSHTPEKTSVSGTKTWNDNDDQDGKRPTSITVRLHANGNEIDSKTVTAADNWSYSFTDLDKCAGGEAINYTVTEDAVADYSTEYNDYNIVNSHTPGKTSVTVTKAWDDGNNQDGIRAEEVSVQLYADGTEQGDAVTLSEENNWTHTWTELPEKKAGKAIAYTVAEVGTLEGYTTEVSGTASTGFIITNTHTPEKTSVSGIKTWNDNDNQDGKRPTSITVNLFANGEKVISKEVTPDEEGNWSYRFENLDKYADGEEITYTVIEDAVADYSTEYNGYNIVNSHTPGKTSVTVTKAWDDGNNQDGIRSEEVSVQLYADGTEQGDAVTLSEENNWTHTWTELPEKKAGETIAYTVAEVETVEGYTMEVSGTASTGFVVTNTHTPEKTSVSGTKTWNDNDDQDGMRPTSITVRLLADGVEKASQTVTAEDNWSYSFTDLDKCADGEEITYTVTEDAVADYSTEYNGYNIVNSHTPGKTSVTVTKAWDDGNNQDGIRSEEVSVQLYADGTEQGDAVTLSEENNWTHTWTELPEKKAGETIAYTVAEVETVEGYTTEVSGTASTGFIVTNSHKPEKTSVSGTKTWNDNDDQDGMRPTSITVRLHANGNEIDSKTVTAADNWSYSFTDLDKCADGEEISYTVTEDVVEDYSTEYDGYNIVNSHIPGKTSVTVTKAWDDGNNQDGIRAEEVSVQLYADEVKQGDEVTLNEENNWTHTWTELPEKKAGKAIAYTVAEVGTVEGYTTEVSGTASTGFIITNTHTPEKISVSGTKTWNDNDNQDGKRPTSITVRLHANGNEIASKTVTAADNWSYSFKDLDKCAGGEAINYTVTEDAVAGYTASVKDFNITNTHAPEKTSVSGTKTWNDNDDQDGKRPTSITVRLLADGVEKASQTVTAEDNWSYSFTDLDKCAGGKAINYTVTEDAVADYSTEYNDYNIVNSHTPGKTSVTVTKAWDDGNNQDGIRAEEVSVQLYADGVKQGDAVTLNEENNWTHTWTELPEKKAGKAIAYTVAEVGTVEGYTTEVSGTASTGFIITNTHAPEKTSVSGTKTWNDSENLDGMRPTSITVNLFANGEQAATKTVAPDETGNWNYSFEDLDKYADGEEIVYTVTEDAVEGYTTTVTGYNIVNTRDLGDLEVSKSVSGNSADENKQFAFTVTLDNTNITGIYGEMTFEAGVAEFTLKHGQTVKATGLPTGISYNVTEDAEEYTATVDAKQGTISKNETAQVNFLNTYNTYGDLTVSKTVAGNAASESKEFNFTVTLSDTTLNDTYGDMTFVNGVASFTLKHNESKKAENLPNGITYTVTEEDYSAEGYEVTKSGDSGSIVGNEEATAEFINTRRAVLINKIDITTEEEVVGAVLQVLDKSGNVMDEWTSDGSNHEVDGMHVGESYTLRETTAPSAYYTITKDVVFTVDEAGNVTIVSSGVNKDGLKEAEVSDGVILVKDTARPTHGDIVVTKRVLANGEPVSVDWTFYTALFEDAAGTIRCSDVKTLAVTAANGGTAKVTFENVPFGTYYVFETNADGSLYKGTEEGFHVQVSVENGTVTLTEENLHGSAAITNNFVGELPDGFTNIPEESEVESEETNETEDLPEGKTYTKPSGTAAKTGDNTNVLIYLILIAAALGAGTGTLYYKKKKRTDKRK